MSGATASGRSAPATPAQGVALAARHAGVPCSVMVMDTAPRDQVEAIAGSGPRWCRATYDECWQTVEAHASPRMRGRFVHPFDDDRFIAGNAHAGLEILEDLPDVDAIVGAVRRRRPPERRRFGGHARCGRQRASIAAEPETAAPLATSLRNGRASRFDDWRASFVDGAGGKSVLPTMWPLLSRLSSRPSSCRCRRRRGDEARRRSLSRRHGGRRRMRGRRGADRTDSRGTSWRSCLAATSTSDVLPTLGALLDEQANVTDRSSL